MIRLVCRLSDGVEAVHTQGPVRVEYRTFDVNLPEVEAFLRQEVQYGHVALVGAELIERQEVQYAPEAPRQPHGRAKIVGAADSSF